MKKLFITMTLVCASAAFAQDTSSAAKKASKKKAAAAQNSAQITIPKGAVLDPKDGNYHYTDKSGRKWVYMMTPMGPSRWEDKGAASAQPQPETSNQFSRDPNLKAIDQGDTVKFVRNTPFGPQSWTKKKSELSDDERAMIANPPAAPGEKAQN